MRKEASRLLAAVLVVGPGSGFTAPAGAVKRI
jgi:hypothetical protein